LVACETCKLFRHGQILNQFSGHTASMYQAKPKLFTQRISKTRPKRRKLQSITAKR
jgi:hypothetical protein